MDTWEKMYKEARTLFNPHEVSDFVYANHVVAAVEAEDGQIFTGFCMEGTCRDKPPYGEGSGMPCGACREFLLELNAENKEAEFMMNYETRKTIKVAELIPYWWGEERATNWQDK